MISNESSKGNYRCFVILQSFITHLDYLEDFRHLHKGVNFCDFLFAKLHTYTKTQVKAAVVEWLAPIECSAECWGFKPCSDHQLKDCSPSSEWQRKTRIGSRLSYTVDKDTMGSLPSLPSPSPPPPPFCYNQEAMGLNHNLYKTTKTFRKRVNSKRKEGAYPLLNLFFFSEDKE